MKRAALLLVLALGLAPVPAAADGDAFRDPDEQPFCESPGPCPDGDYMDFRRVAHGHGKAPGTLRHGIETRLRWRTKTLGGRHGTTIAIDFDTDGDRGVERQLRIRRKAGELVARMLRGKFQDKEVPGRVEVWRPDHRSVKVRFRAGLLGADVAEYRWRAHWWDRGLACPGSCHTDYAPNKGWYGHEF